MDNKSNDDSAGSDSLDKSMQIKCVMVETTTGDGDSNADAMRSPEDLDNCSRDSAAESMGKGSESVSETAVGAVKQADHKTEAAAGSRGEGDSPQSSQSPPEHPANSSHTSSCTAFETKVKLISQNLKETTLAENCCVSVSASTSASSSSSLLESQTPNNSTTDTDSAAASVRVKKVRFHPDVKENDGGNWVKKKRRSTQTKRASSPSGANCDGMEMDGEAEEEEYETNDDEEEFDLAKTIAEAEDYLKQHPLTFVQRVEQNGERLQDGLLSIEDMLNEVGEEVVTEYNDEDFFRRIKPENGIERILGKETKAGKVEFLLRYENQGGLFWESEEFVRRTCPSLLKAYEKNRERRQQRLMHHVAKRQSLRQRYTDF
ncbi:uncharacterized protein LOC108036812 [Drosophila biarmipes]|uniref:uncharacterized protein LOC108036812 n=1 Tax=Drosophila biarmipes TaxID=125945 RepID=UPI0007E7A439|nr:uncharacterized protein LOC108036812 [Drosophila biarmipes]XP_050741240.1 uncharacterized protein LOC108036812 [Drosophila biarmipes]